MPINKKYIEDFVENDFMHVICKSVSNTQLFKNDNNRLFFLQKYANYTLGYLETYSYVMLDNHVHWLVKSVSAERLRKHLEIMPDDLRKLHQSKFINGEINYAEAIEYQCKDFFISYAMAYNKCYKRSGALFLNPFRRVRIKDEKHLCQIIVYQHANPLKHKVDKDFVNYPWSSYQSILSDKQTMLKRVEVLDLFGGKDSFINTHKELIDFYYTHPLGLE